jgi:tRNA threonylcarbamoyladenosine biosynthesis protein TsaE
MAEWTFTTSSPAETRRAGERLGRVLAAGDVVLLDGELGAGKTCFVQGVARGLGVARGRRVASPTFAIMNEHPARRATLKHIDLYRVDDPDELIEVGVADVLRDEGESGGGGGGVAVVEWAARLGALTPRDRIDVRIEATGARTRRLRVAAVGAAAARRVAAWRRATKKETT